MYINPDHLSKMSKFEYEYVQERLSAKMNKSRRPSNREDGYNEGILCAKSIIKELYGRRISDGEV